MSLGIDISTWQDVRDYGALARSVEYVILKAGGSNTGSQYVDSKYHRHAAEFAKHSVPVGAYWMQGAGPVAADARFFIKNLRADTRAMVVLDIETIDGYNHWSPSQAMEWFRIVRDALPGASLFAYMNTSVAQSADWKPLEREGVGLWLANYGADNGSLTSPNPGTGTWSTWAVHQYTQQGRLAGYNGPLDLNRAKAGVLASRPAPSGPDVKRFIAAGIL